MAQTPAPGVQLYLYRLFTKEFGTGRQTLLPKAEEALSADGIELADLDCADMLELMNMLDFATITTFKGGRVYTTFAARPDFDEALATLTEAEGEVGKTKKGGKPWKRKRAALKPIRPQKRVTKKPKHVREVEEAPTTEEAQKLVEATLEAQDAVSESDAPQPVHTQDVNPETPSTPADSASHDTHETATLAPTPLPRSLPVAFWDEVRCPDELLAELANLLPLDVDAHSLLEEDWKVARATGSLRYERATASFDLRYASADGTPIAVALERGMTGSGGKRWVVTSIEGSASKDNDWTALKEATLAAEGAWADLSASRLPAYLRRNLLGEFAEAVSIGSWDNLCARIAELAKPEPWGPKGASELPILREYLLVSLTRALEQERLIATKDVAIWNTGLVTQDFEPVCCFFGPIGADGTRPLVDVLAAKDGRLTNQDVPISASYLESLNDLLISPDSHIAAAPKSRIPQAVAERALRRAVASWREVVPIWDPQEHVIKFLLPASTSSPDEVDAVLVVERDSSNVRMLLATQVLPLDRAYMLARVVSDTQPAWLAKTLSA